MAKKQVINLKNIAKFSMVSTLMLGVVIAISTQASHIAISIWSTFAYIIVSLIFSVSVFMLFLRHYKITSDHYILMRAIATIGAISSCGVWVLLVYPITVLLNKL